MLEIFIQPDKKGKPQQGAFKICSTIDSHDFHSTLNSAG